MNNNDKLNNQSQNNGDSKNESGNQASVNDIEKQNNKKDDSSDLTKMGRLTWTDQTEELLVGWADVSACYKWLHEDSYRKYSKKNYYFAVPIIVLSTLSGTLSVSISGYVPEQYVSYAQAGIGAVNIFTGVLTTLQSLFKYAQLSEAHNNVSIGWSKLQRNIAIALSVDRDSRGDADSFIKICRSEYDRLIEQSPSIPEDVIQKFKDVYQKQQQRKAEEKKKREKSVKNGIPLTIEEELILPDICDAIHHTKVFKEIEKERKEIIDYNRSQTSNTSSTTGSPVDSFKKKINSLENKISGVNQWKTAMMSERLAPLIQENNVLSHNKEIDIIHPSINSQSFKNENIPPLNHLRSIIGGAHLNNQRRYSLSQNKEYDYSARKTISLGNRNKPDYSLNTNNFSYTSKKEEIEVPKGKVKNLINRYRHTISNDSGPDDKVSGPENSEIVIELQNISSSEKSSPSSESILPELNSGLPELNSGLQELIPSIENSISSESQKINNLSNTEINSSNPAIPGALDSDIEISINSCQSDNENLDKTPIATPIVSKIDNNIQYESDDENSQIIV
jgi:hypothetical protein